MKRKWSVCLAIFVALVFASLLITRSAALSIATASITFPEVSLNGYDQTVLGTTSAWLVDATGETGGWNATVLATDFANGVGGVIHVSNLEFRLVNTNIALVSGDPTLPISTQTEFAALSGSPLKFVSAENGNSDGVYDLLPEFRLYIPAESYVGNYTTTLTITVSTGP